MAASAQQQTEWVGMAEVYLSLKAYHPGAIS